MNENNQNFEADLNEGCPPAQMQRTETSAIKGVPPAAMIPMTNVEQPVQVAQQAQSDSVPTQTTSTNQNQSDNSNE